MPCLVAPAPITAETSAAGLTEASGTRLASALTLKRLEPGASERVNYAGHAESASGATRLMTRILVSLAPSLTRRGKDVDGDPHDDAAALAGGLADTGSARQSDQTRGV